jgi:hypothetical protein
MKTLEELIRDAAAAGRLSGFSIVKDPAGRGWQANAPSRSGGNAWTVSVGPDPVDALIRALGGSVSGVVAAAPVDDLEDMLG